MIGKRLINTGVAAADALVPSENFNTVLYTGNGSTQRIGGYINRGAVFNGTTSSYIDYAPLEGFFHQKQTFTLSLWFYTSSTNSGGGTLFTDYAVQSFNILAYIQNSNIIVESRYNSAGTTYTSSATYLNAWTHLCVTSDGTTRKVYVNGSLESTQTLSTNGWTSSYSDNRVQSGALRNDANNTQNNPYNGKLDQVRIFNKALSSSEVTTLYGETHASTTISTTDIFSDNSGVALYQLDGNANDTGGVSGKFGSAAIFNGSSSVIQTSGLNQFFNNWNDASWSAWINTTDTSAQYIVCESTDSQNYKLIGGISSNKFQIVVRKSGTVYSATSTTTINDGNWHHIAATYDNSTGTVKGYVDGSEEISLSTGGTSSGTFTVYDFCIGANKQGSNVYNPLDGKIDDVRIYSDVLTSTEVGYIYNNTTASIPTDNLEAYYKLDGDARDEQQLYDGTATNVTYAYDGTATNVTYQEATKFQPDLVWIKSRYHSTYAFNHTLFDSVRGANEAIYSNLTLAEQTSVLLPSFDSNGFTVSTTGGGNTNWDTATYAAWCFKGGGTAVSNTDGSLTTSVSSNQDAGFSIIEYTDNGSSNTIGHGLSSAPELWIVKRTSGSQDWYVGSTALAATQAIKLNSTNAAYTTGGWQNTYPTDSVININIDSGDYICYAFHSVDGYSKIGSYTGSSTGSTPNYIETGFEPAWIMIKCSSDANDWVIFDRKRDTDGTLSKILYANTSAAEVDGGATTSLNVDSNGFSFDGSQYGGSINYSGRTYIYLAIAADPDTTTPTVENSFDVVTWTGDDTTNRLINVDFKPDFIWVKNRTTSTNHTLVDSIRGANNLLFSDITSAALTTNTILLPSINDSGFTVGYDGTDVTNGANNNYVAWCWKAGDHDDNLPQINTEGSIDSVVSVNAAAGFSIVKYTGNGGSSQSVGHGLSSAPEMVIFKRTDAAQNWFVFVKVGGVYKRFEGLNTTAAATSVSSFSASSTSITWSGTTADFNGSSREYIMYCFHSVSGYQKIGSYDGGTLSSSNIENVGFRPRFVMLKQYEVSGNNWVIYDTVRDATNPHSNILYPNLSNQEAISTTDNFNLYLTDNGFYFNNTVGYLNNTTSGDVIYLAIA